MRGWQLWLVAAGTLVGGPLSAQQSFRDCPTCPEMVVLPPGSFLMGVPPGEEEREGLAQQFLGRSVPQHRVTIGYSFSLGRYEVTRAQFAAFVEATGYATRTSCYTVNEYGRFSFTRDRDWRNPGFAQTANDPVVCVNWNDAQAYVEWLKRTTGKAYRLPSESEWEYAARAGSRFARYWGDGRDDACLYGNMSDLTLANRYNFEKTEKRFVRCADGHAHTAPVGQFRANGFGLHDMLGNVWEWTGDCWNANYDGAPVDGHYWGAPGDCSERVARGGSWNYDPEFIRAGYRFSASIEIRISVAGFRVARGN